MFTAKRFLFDESGATAIEYALVAGLVFLAIVASVTNFALSVNKMYNNISGNMH